MKNDKSMIGEKVIANGVVGIVKSARFDSASRLYNIEIVSEDSKDDWSLSTTDDQVEFVEFYKGKPETKPATYTELNKRAEERISTVPMFFAFSDAQFKEGCKKIGVTDPKKELVSTGAGSFIAKEKAHLLHEAMDASKAERKTFLESAEGLKSAFYYELGNHEYCITYNDSETWEAVGLSMEDSTKFQRVAFVEARAEYLQWCEDNDTI